MPQITVDRSIPFYNTILRCDKIDIPLPYLPAGYAFKMYEDGDEVAWAVLHLETGDFDTESEAVEYFMETYLNGKLDIYKRCVFVINPSRQIIGACIAWQNKKYNAFVPSLHWLVVCGCEQGKGIGKALLIKTMEIFKSYNECPVYIHTQPWSYKAITLYVRHGFKIQKSDSFSHYENQFSQAMSKLNQVLPENIYNELENCSE